MSLTFFSDHCVPAEIPAFLRDHGHSVILLRDVLPIRALDPDVIAKAQDIQAILLSLNGDFADIVAYPPANFAGIVALQLHNHPEVIPTLLERFAVFLAANPEQDYYRGKLFIVEPHRIRIRG